MPTQRYLVRIIETGVPGRRGAESKRLIEATPRQIAREAAKLVKQGAGHVSKVIVAPETNSGHVLIHCEYSLRISSPRAISAKRRGYAEKSFARCSMTPTFKQQVSPKRKRRARR